MDFFEKLTQTKETYLNLMKSEGSEALKELFNDFFLRHTDVSCVYWTQYTPYFNDGEPCEFGVHEADFIRGDFNDEEDERCSYGESIYSLYEFGPGGYKDLVFKTDEDKSLYEDMHSLNKTLQGNYDLMQIVFGDHCEVIVTRDKITIEEYSHE